MKLLIAALVFNLRSFSFPLFSFPNNVYIDRTRIFTVNLNDEHITSVDDSLSFKTDYQPGAADTLFAKQYAHFRGIDVRSTDEAFADFTRILGCPVRALYMGMITELVDITHLTVVNARFVRDAIWSLGIMTTLHIVLKNYPEKHISRKIERSLYECVDLDENEILNEAQLIHNWAASKSLNDISYAIREVDTSPISNISKAVKDNKYWMYSRFFSVGLLKIIEIVGVNMTVGNVYPIMKEWMKNMGKSHLTACADSDHYFKLRDKLDNIEEVTQKVSNRTRKKIS